MSFLKKHSVLILLITVFIGHFYFTDLAYGMGPAPQKMAGEDNSIDFVPYLLIFILILFIVLFTIRSILSIIKTNNRNYQLTAGFIFLIIGISIYVWAESHSPNLGVAEMMTKMDSYILKRPFYNISIIIAAIFFFWRSHLYYSWFN